MVNRDPRPPTPVLENTLWPYPHPTPVQAYSWNTIQNTTNVKKSKNMHQSVKIRAFIDAPATLDSFALPKGIIVLKMVLK